MIIPIGLIILLMVYVVYTVYLWRLGGIERTIAYYLLLGLAAFAMINWIAVYAYKCWEKVNIPATPWFSYTLLTHLPHNSLAFKHFLICLLGSAIAIIALFAAKLFSASKSAEKVFGNAHFSNALEVKRAGLFNNTGIVIGKAFGKILRLPGFESVLVTAPMGSGKTTSIAVPNLLEWQGSGIFNDLKGELFKLTASFRERVLKNKCYCFAPANEIFQTHRYNPFFYVSENPNLRIRDLQLIAEIIIPAEKVDGGFWYTSSRDVFILLAIYLFETQGTATLAEIHDLSKQDDFFIWLDFQVKQQIVKDLVFYQNAYSILNSDAEKTQKNILKDFHSRMMLFADPLIRHATSNNDFDLKNLRKEKMSIYIQIPDSDKQRLKPILTLFWAQVTHLMTSYEPNIKKEPYPVLALLDEFGNMARIEKLKEGMSFLRSYRMRAIIIVQYLSQIYSTYGQYDAKGFLNTKVKIAFALNDIDDAKFFSESLGKKTVKVKSQGTSHGHHSSISQNIGFQSRPLMMPDEIMQMSDDQSIILLEARSPIKAKKCYFYTDKHYKGLKSVSN